MGDGAKPCTRREQSLIRPSRGKAGSTYRLPFWLPNVSDKEGVTGSPFGAVAPVKGGGVATTRGDGEGNGVGVGVGLGEVASEIGGAAVVDAAIGWGV